VAKRTTTTRTTTTTTKRTTVPNYKVVSPGEQVRAGPEHE